MQVLNQFPFLPAPAPLVVRPGVKPSRQCSGIGFQYKDAIEQVDELRVVPGTAAEKRHWLVLVPYKCFHGVHIPDVVSVHGGACDSRNRFTCLGIALVGKLAVAVDGVVTPPPQLIADRRLAGAGAALDEVVLSAHARWYPPGAQCPGPGKGWTHWPVTGVMEAPAGRRRSWTLAWNKPQSPKGIQINRFTSQPLAALTALLLAASLAGCDSAANAFESMESAPGVPAYGTGPAGSGTAGEAAAALVQLEGITVKGRAPKTGYTRDQFGPAWADTDHNGCDTRNDILARDMAGETFKPGTNNCVVATGTLQDKYTGTTITFVRGQDTSSEVQIDHIVPLSDAWQKGAQQLSAGQRKEFANDPLNLMAADGPANSAKGDKDAATWLPPNRAFRCEYVARQTAVKAKYSLWVTQAEHDAIANLLQGCT